MEGVRDLHRGPRIAAGLRSGSRPRLGQWREPAVRSPRFNNQGIDAMATGKLVSYLRVSPDRQGRSGLGFEAQRNGRLSRASWTAGTGKLITEFVEVESGKLAERPKLGAALH
jgi:hypothetical protein